MEDARASTSSQRLASTSDTLLESQEGEITDFHFSDLSNFQQETVEIYWSQYKNWFMAAKQQEWEILQSLWIGTRNSYLQVKKLMGPERTQDLLKGWTPMSFKGEVQKIKAWFKNQSIFSEDQKKDLAQKKDNSPVETSQASTSKNQPQQVPKKDKQAQKSNQKGKKKVKGKEKSKWNKPYPQNYRIPKKEEKFMDHVFNMARDLMELKKKRMKD
ncbi:hypothetical protein O181_003282 [Austropuccinia psidii MF-1]|uniref:Uncharacterized protein n=1 Tax=Austropuccinia psidii MF-1 TaxID=1389203 RepID=A0A9Q3BE34_9BASI|nr:hypothetical protein [Austropuccinia psidii MF-1]